MESYDISNGGLRLDMITVSSTFDQNMLKYGPQQSGLESSMGWRPSKDNMFESITVSNEYPDKW